MKVQDFIKVMKGKMLKGAQLEEFVSKTLEVKKYIGIKEKKKLVDSIVRDCVIYEDGVFKFDEIEQYITFMMKTIAAYTNLEMSDDLEEDYDALCENNLLDVVVDTFKKEYEEVNILLQMRCGYILSANNIEAQVGKFLHEISDKTDGLLGVLSNKFGALK